MIATTWTELEQSHQALRATIAGVGTPDWGRVTPCAQWNVAQVLRHAAADQRAYAAAMTGEDGPDDDPFAPSAEPPGDPAALLGPALAVAARAFAATSPADPAVPTPLPQGPLPASIAAGAAALDAAVHAWDIAVATGQPSPLDASLAGVLIPVAAAIAEPLRGFAYDTALPPVASDGPVAALLRHLGRDPAWTA
jgi:uncharacterized protein (TIGR03086 family)